MNRRGFLTCLLSTAAAATVDFEQLLWVPKPIIIVPAMPEALCGPYSGQMIAAAWEAYVNPDPEDNIFDRRLLFEDWRLAEMAIA